MSLNFLLQRLGEQEVMLPVLFVSRLAQGGGDLRPMADAVQHGMRQNFPLAGRDHAGAARLKSNDLVQVLLLRGGEELLEFFASVFGDAEDLVQVRAA